jgi:hypothetical protein
MAVIIIGKPKKDSRAAVRGRRLIILYSALQTAHMYSNLKSIIVTSFPNPKSSKKDSKKNANNKSPALLNIPAAALRQQCTLTCHEGESLAMTTERIPKAHSVLDVQYDRSIRVMISAISQLLH